MLFLVRSILILLSFCCSQNSVFSQNYVEEFLVKESGDQIKINFVTLEKIKYKLMPFDSRVYTLLRFYPVQFKKEKKEQMLAPLKDLSVKIQAIELMDQSIMLTFKDISAQQLKINVSDETRKIEITVLPKMFTKLGYMDPVNNNNGKDNRSPLKNDHIQKAANSAQGSSFDKSSGTADNNPIRSEAKYYLQLGLFLSIIFFLLVWGFVLWRKRRYFSGSKKQASADFSKIVTQLHKNPRESGNEKSKISLKQSQLRLKKISSSAIKKSLDEMSRDLASKNEVEDKIFYLAARGFSVEEIAKQLQLGKGEVQLILDYKKKKTMMPAPLLRIEMDEL